ncbi:MAG: four helix bundle protein [Clostridia bacterium]|nr:four helix bundle protein [Clostridia bacterium]
MKKNKLLEMAQTFAVEMIGVAKDLKCLGERNIADQIERSGTSISANIAEANHPQSRLDMISKFEIALKEANETENWLIVSHDAGLIEEGLFSNLHKQLIQIKILLISSIRTLKETK